MPGSKTSLRASHSGFHEDVAAGRVIQLETEDEIDALFASL
jgi:hypothetical protein